MTRAEIRAAVRILLGQTDNSNSYYTDANINIAIDIALQKVSTEIPRDLTFYDITTTAGTQRYSLQADFLRHSHIRIIIDSSYSYRLEQLDMDEFDAVMDGSYDRTGQPKFYKIELGAVSNANDPQVPGDIWLADIPDSNGGNDYTLRHYYYQRAFLSDDAEVPEFPESLHEAIIYYAAMFMTMKDDNQTKTRNYASLYRTSISDGKKLMHKRSGETGLTPKDVGYGDNR